jgi:hypothetical protein
VSLDRLRNLPWSVARAPAKVNEPLVSHSPPSYYCFSRGRGEKGLTVFRVELHASLDLEAGRVLVRADPDENEPLAIGPLTVVDDLAPSETR